MGSRVSVEKKSWAQKRNSKINKQLKGEDSNGSYTIKLLLLGTAESGKSTIVKQMRILYLQGFSHTEIKCYRQLVRANMLDGMLKVLSALEKLEIELQHSGRIRDKESLLLFDLKFGIKKIDLLSADHFRAIKRLWHDTELQMGLQRCTDVNLNDGAKYFLDNIDRISKDYYIPSEQDILRARSKTTGVSETRFRHRGLQFRLIDVGGQRSERKKWFHCFEDVAAVLFCVAMSEYSETLDEDTSTNRMEESMRLFQSVCYNRNFKNTSMILFLNKIDLLEEKLKTHPLKTCFPRYSGPETVDEASHFLRETFNHLKNPSGDQKIYSHFTCATDTQNIQVVFDAVCSIVISQNLKTHGFHA